MKSRIFLSTLLSICFCFTLQAQPGMGYGNGQRQGGMTGGITSQNNRSFISGNVYLSPLDKDGMEEPGVGAIVLIVSEKRDSMYTTVGESGKFRMFNVPTGKAYVSFSLLGYEDEAKVIDITPGENKMVAYLKPMTFQLEGAQIKETVNPVSVKQDTIIFHAAAVKVNKGEMAIDLLEQMPGVEVSESSVTVLNEEVKNVYIDGALLFGEAPMKALNNLSAEDVVDIKSYQEYANKDPYHKIGKNETKQRVLDVRTKSKPKFVTNVNALAGAGFDTDSTYHKFRYTSGVTVGTYSERLQANLNFNLNNINDSNNSRRGNVFRTASSGGSADLRNLNVSADVTKKWMSPTTKNFVLGAVGGSYSYSDQYNVNESITNQVYFPSGKYTSREVDKTSYSDATSKAHTFSAKGEKALRDGNLSLTATMKLTDNLNNSISESYNTQDNLAKQGTKTNNQSQSNGKNFSSNFNFDKRFADKFGVALKASGNWSDSDNTSTKIDSTTSTITKQILDIAGTGFGRSFRVAPTLSWQINEESMLTLQYNYNNTFNSTERVAYDISSSEPVLDLVNSYTHIVDNNVHTTSLNYSNNLEKLGNALLNAGVNWSSTGLNRHESFPEEDFYDKRFDAWGADFSLGTQSMINRWTVNVNTTNSTPSVEQIRPRIDNTNIYSISAGNPNLKQSHMYNIGFGYSTVIGAEMQETAKKIDKGLSSPREIRNLCTFAADAGFSVATNPIVNRRIYYSEETYLQDYDYLIPAQATFSTWENSENSYSANANARFDIPLQKIMWNLNTTLSMGWDSSPSYVDYQLTRTQNLRPSLRVGMRSNFSRKVRLNISTNASYIYSNNNLRDYTSYFIERINLGWEINSILKILYTGGNYSKTFTQGLAYKRVDDNIFNIKTGLRFGPQNNYDFSISVHDLFNATTGFTTSMTSDYVTNSWKHNFGRYVLFTFAYRFNSAGGSGGGMGMGGFGPRM